MKTIIIAEKPSLARTIKSALYKEDWVNKDGYVESSNYILTNVLGHLLTLYDVDDYLGRDKTAWNIDELPFIPSEYKYKVKDNSGVKKQLKLILSLINRNDVDTIISAGDPDDEGTRLINSTVQYCFNKLNTTKKVLRLWATEQNEPSIRDAMRNLKPNEQYNCYDDRALARAESDWCIGINQSRFLTLKFKDAGGKGQIFPSGRVLTCIVNYIYDRYIEQKNFVPQKYFNIGQVIKFVDGNEITLVLKDLLFKEYEEINAIELINELNSCKTYVKSIDKKKVKKYPNKLFSLTTLQNKLAKEYKFTNKDVLAIAQSLYEKKLITYPRAKSEYLPDSDKDKVKKILEKYKELYSNIEFKDTPRIFDSEKVGTDHAALIPTIVIPDLDKLTSNEKLVYEIIRNRFFANFCAEDCIIENTKIIIGNNINDYISEIKGVHVIQKGFLAIENTIEEKGLPALNEGEVLNSKYNVNECYTKAPINVNTTELNKFMESPFSKENETEEEKYKKMLSGLEIGTVATRAGIIDNATKYGYINENKGIFTITEKGIFFIENSKKLGVNITAMQTAKIGQLLQAVFERRITVKQCVEMVENKTSSDINKAKGMSCEGYSEEKEVVAKCTCGKNIYESAKCFYCEGFKDKSCNFIINKQERFLYSKGKTLTKSLLARLLKNGSASVKGLKRKDGSKYDANIRIVKNGQYYNIDFAEKTETEELKCPRCGQKVLEGSNNFYCTGYKNEPPCSYKVWKENKFLTKLGIKLTSNHIKKLIQGKKIRFKIKNKEKNTTKEYTVYLEDTGDYINYKVDFN